jgi:hypothetical protein
MEEGGGSRQRHLVPSQSSMGINGSRLGNRAPTQRQSTAMGGNFVSTVVFFGRNCFLLLVLEALADGETSGPFISK